MASNYSEEEKDAVIEFCIECIEDRFNTSNSGLWFFIDTDDTYMRE